MASSFLFLVSCIIFFNGSTHARSIPIRLREINDVHVDHVNVRLGVKDVTNSSALLDWNMPDEHLVLNFKISCQGYSNSAKSSAANSESTTDHSLEHVVPKNTHHFQLKNLKPNYSYSCSLVAAEFDEESFQEKNKLLIAPIHFTTLSISTGISKSGSILDLINLKEKYGDKSAFVVLGVGVPLCIAVVAAGVGICVLCRKCNAYRERKNNTHRKVFEDKLNRRLKGVVYNPLAMEYTTKWDQPNTPGTDISTKFPLIHNGYKSGQGLKKGGFDKRIPYGKLSLNDLVNRVEQARQNSPFADAFKSNDPVKIDTPPFHSLSSLSMSISSLELSDEETIRTKPVIPNLKLSTPVFKQPRKTKLPRKPSDRKGISTAPKKLTPLPRPCQPRASTKAVLVQPKGKPESDTGSESSIDIFVAPHFLPSERATQA